MSIKPAYVKWGKTGVQKVDHFTRFFGCMCLWCLGLYKAMVVVSFAAALANGDMDTLTQFTISRTIESFSLNSQF